MLTDTFQCSGRPAPCRACHNIGVDCAFDLSLDLRRKVAQRRTIGEREYYRHVLLSLLNALRSSEPARINELVNFIRGSASMSRIATALTDTTIGLEDFSSVDLYENPSMEDAILNLLPPSGSCSEPRITLENLVDIPLFQVPAKPWTNVTDDDDLVSHLVSLYFTWDHPCWQVVDQAVFLLHMRSGDMESKYCTPFLVNSILAMASVRTLQFPFGLTSDCSDPSSCIPIPPVFLPSREMKVLADPTSIWKPRGSGRPKRVQ